MKTAARRNLNARRHRLNAAAAQPFEKSLVSPGTGIARRNTVMVENLGAGIERYMSLLSARQKLVAANIANADTPGYKTKDIDFQSELASQMSGSPPDVIEVPGLKTKNDGNNVSMDREARLLAENALRFSLASNLVRSEISLVRTAIQEDKNA